MPDKKCPYCGNDNFKRKTIKNDDGFPQTSDYCSICDHRVGVIEISQAEIEFLKSHEDQEWKEYAEEIGLDKFPWGGSSLWKKYLFTKNKTGQVTLNLTAENIDSCEELYNKCPDDNDNLIRLLLLKIFLGQDCKGLVTKFINIWQKELFLVSSLFTALVFDIKIYEAIEPYLPKLRNFLLWLLDTYPKQFEIAISEIEDPYGFKSILKIIGASEVCRIIDSEDLYFCDIFIDEGYVQTYVTAESCYSGKKWFDGFILFQKLKTFNDLHNIKDEELYEEFKDEVWYFSDILHSPPTLQVIENKLYECFSKLLESNEKTKLYDFINKHDQHLWFYGNKVFEKDEEINNYSQLYSVFSEIIKENYDEAYKKWIQWNKHGITLAGLDIWAVTKSIINLRDGVGNKKSNIKNLLSANPFMEDLAIISDLEIKLREFIFDNLGEYYGNDENGWRKGVPEEIRVKCVTRKETDYNIESPKRDFSDFSDYAQIICFKGNWENIFKKYFILEKNDVQKHKEKLTLFLNELVPLRNTVFHLRRVLELNEREKLKTYSGTFYKVYSKWKDNKQLKHRG